MQLASQKSGYKQTEVGVIPAEWNTPELGECGAVVMGQSPPGSTYNRTGSGSALINGPTEFTAKYPVKIQWTTQPARFCKTGDLLICVRGSSTGRTNFADDVYAIGRGVAAIRAEGKNNTAFLSHQVISAVADILAVTTGSTFPSIDGNSLRKIRIPLPPTLAEQEAIASALSDADGLIESLETLIAKKRQIKHGTMQELLTGNRRLPGFTGEWGSERLGDLGRWTGGMTPSMRNPDYWKLGSIPWISSGDVKAVRLTTTGVSITEFAVKQRTTTLLPVHSIVVVTRSGILRKYLPVAINTVPMAINQDIKALLPGSGIVPEYVLHALISNGERILASCLKSGTTVESIEFRWLKAFTIPFPSTPAEQTAIALILSDMDAEIAVLETKLAKARQVKQGMMQELLTGRVRLV